jgi:hypothetical protein
VELLDQLVRLQSAGEILKRWCRSELPAEDLLLSVSARIIGADDSIARRSLRVSTSCSKSILVKKNQYRLVHLASDKTIKFELRILSP